MLISRLQNVCHLSYRRGAGFATSAGNRMSWPEYFDLRRSKRRWELAATMPSTLLAAGGGLIYFGNLEGDVTKPIFGIDPLYVYGLAGVGCTGLGYLAGPFVGNFAWRIFHRRVLPSVDALDKEFYRHVVRNRVDPTTQSARNPVPDFYGEKIGSLHQYRQWLRDQAKFRRKLVWLKE